MGSGKSAVGALVAERERAPFFDLDRMIESEAGASVSEVFAARGEAGFRAVESRLLPSALRPGAVAALGGGTPSDDGNWALITARATSVYLEVAMETILARIGDSPQRPLAAGRTREQLQALLDARRPRYEQAMHRVDANRDPEVVAAEVATLWSD
jgi:shikimate kinase